jgi:hypothetical protein
MTSFRENASYVALMIGMILGAASPTYAVDGVLEINQACAVNTGWFAGDTAGFPVTVTVAGSYRLTSNLTVAATSTSGIKISVDNVTVDLNGFAISGPIICSGDGGGISCSPAGGGFEAGVEAVCCGPAKTVVRNGTVNGFPNGIRVNSDSRVDSIIATSNENDGIVIGIRSAATRCLSHRNGDDGIATATGDVTDSVLFSENVTQDNGGDGIYMPNVQGTIRGNASASNGGNGIFGGATVVENTSRGNGGDGIVSNGMIANNGVSGNDGDEIQTAGSSSTLVIGNNISSSGPGGSALNLSAQTSFINNAIKGVVTGGIDVSGNRCNGVPCP